MGTIIAWIVGLINRGKVRSFEWECRKQAFRERNAEILKDPRTLFTKNRDFGKKP